MRVLRIGARRAYGGPCTSAAVGVALLAVAALSASGNPIPFEPEPEPSDLPDYWSDSSLLVDVPGASPSLAAGLFNPAAWPMRKTGGLFFSWQDPSEDRETFVPGTAIGNGGGLAPAAGDWAGVLSLGNLAFGMRGYRWEGEDARTHTWREYTVGLGGGTRAGAFGVAYAWSRDEQGEPVRHPRLTVGVIHRWRPLSYGIASMWDLERDDYAVQADLGLRPFGPRLTLFADAVYAQDMDFDEIRTGYGLEVHPLPGLSLGAKALNTGEVSLRLGVGLAGGLHPDARIHLDNDGEQVATTYALETDFPAPSLCVGRRGQNYPQIDLRGPMAYRRFRFFDNRRTLTGTLQAIDAYATDPRVGGVVVNLSGMQISGELVWELREQLAGLRAHGKKVIAYIDEPGMSSYALASVADQVWMDPQGILDVRGVALGRTYLRGTLDKLGLGVDEWRFFTYKSAFETLSRTSMSDPDREQWSALIDDIYETLAQAITTSRGISRESWDRVVNEQAILLPREAQAAGLIDSIGTFDQAKKAARQTARRTTPDPSQAALGELMGDATWGSMEWGAPPRIAILYAIGPCAMDTGIKGRLLSKKIKAAREDRSVKAVVLRADSPGGDALPSDLVARELLETSRKKPVIVSQGVVAGSGGYWISMYGDTIVAAPMTLTGSIGVIGGWIWDNGFGDKLGITWDGVKRGAHADLEQGMRLPLVNAVVPERPLTAEEHARMETLIRDSYQTFVDKVAEGRGMTSGQVDAVGQGRVWSGTRGKEQGLVDEIGGLWRSLQIAKQAAGIPASRSVQITEGPSIGTFNFPMPQLRLLGVLGLGGATKDAPVSDADIMPAVAAIEAAAGTTLALPEAERIYLEYLLRSQGRPLLMMEPLRLTDGSEN